jgi:hypothetical protein
MSRADPNFMNPKSKSPFAPTFPYAVPVFYVGYGASIANSQVRFILVIPYSPEGRGSFVVNLNRSSSAGVAMAITLFSSDV